MTPMTKAAACAALAAAALTAACGVRKPLPEGAELIPADTTFALSLDVQALTSSRLYEMYQDQAILGKNRLNFYKFAEATGLDPGKDVQRVIFLARAGEGGLEEMSGVAIGTFDGRKVSDFLKDSGLPSHDVAGMPIYEILFLEGRCRFCVAVADASTALFGDGETLAKIAQVRAGRTAGLSSEERPGRLLRRMQRDPEAWGIIRAHDLKGPLQQALGRLDANTGGLAALGPLQELAFSFDTAEPMRVLVEMSASSEKDAMRMADVLKGGESLARLALEQTKPEMGRLLQDLVIEADTGLVRMAGSIPSSDVDTVVRVLGIGRMMEEISPPAPPDPPEAPVFPGGASSP
ncbi:MAG TPA: hypothetical protein VJV23_06310 [Candidatus Polarisedimenticolia bacterium]|nr:hypothetical protein [Candidatus Polarisedimenticolia bacterium]